MSNTGYKIANGTDVITYVQTTVTTGANAFSSASNMFYGNGSNLSGLTAGTAPEKMVTTNTDQTIVPIKTFTQGIRMDATCIQGRNDGFLYNTIPPGFGTTQPIGHNLSLITASAALTPNDTIVINTSMPTMSAGVWIVSGNLQLTKGTSTWLNNNYIGLSYTSFGGGDMSGGSQTLYSWGAGFSGTVMSCPFPTLHFIATNTNNTSQVRPNIYMYYSNAGNATYTLNFNAAKVA